MSIARFFLLMLSCIIGSITPVSIQAQQQPGEFRIDDAKLSAVIAADIEDAERLSGSDITAEVRSGIVTLAGTAESLLDKRLATQIAKRTRGVLAVQNQILVERSERSDDAIRKDVMQVLSANDSIAQPAIKANVSAGEVALIGKVESLAQKRIAAFATAGVKGVTGIDNQMTVGLSTERTDDELRDEINALIVQSIYFDDCDIDVKVDNHVAKLSGTVFSAAAKDRLEQVAEIWGIAAADVSAVTVDPNSADSSIRKRRYAEVTDDSIETALRRSFRADPIVFSRAEAIQVDVDSGVVTLLGDVNRLRVKKRAARLAQNVIGVNRVVNELHVQYEGKTPGDAKIIRLTQAALARSAQLDRREIRVHCQAAHVSLYGIVDSELEKYVAEWLADGVPGVVHVNNSLAVEPKWKPKSDDQIEADLKRKLKYALFDTSNQIDVTIENGVAILRGEVDTWRQWQAAMDLAIEAGARHPHNLINVRFHPPHGATRYYVPE